MEFTRFALLGLGAGGLYALAAQGIVLVYRGSGVINFAQGAMGLVVAYFYYDMRDKSGWDWKLSLLIAVAIGAVIGALTHLLVMRPLRKATVLSRLIATLGLLLFLREFALRRWTSVVRVVRSNLPRGVYHTIADTNLGKSQVILFVAAIVLTTGLWWFYSRTRFGLASSAAAENQEATSALGWSPDLIAAVNWAAGVALAGLAAIFLAPTASLGPDMTLFVVPALAAALIGRFSSFWLTLGSALAIGVAESEMANYVSEPGWAKAAPFLVLIAVLVMRGRPLPQRGEGTARLPRVGTGQLRLLPLAVVSLVVIGLILWMSVGWVDAMASTFTYAVVLLSLTVLTGFTGQLSLAQYTMAGMGAYIAGRLVANYGLGFELAMLIGVFGAIPLGVLVGLPALRTRGVNLAVVTLGLALTLERLILSNADRTGGAGGTRIGELRLFGIDLGSLRYPERYALLGLVCLLLTGLMVSNLRRGRSGRRLLAVRANERAAASLGINVFGAKLYAFGLASGIAALGGILIAFRNQRIVYTNFGLFDSIFATVQGVIGGIGFVLGAVFGSAGAPGAVIPELFRSIGDIEQWVRLLSGIGVVLVLIQAPDGLAWLNVEGLHRLSAKLRTITHRGPRKRVVYDLPEVDQQRVRSSSLEVRSLTVRFGGVVAVDDVSFAVKPGEVVGLIGPNGAGKTTIIDAITGFVRPTAGSIVLDGVAIEHYGPSRRARAGVGRSFQSLELFDDMTVYDNLCAGCEPRDTLAYATDLVHPGKPQLGAAAIAAVKEFDLAADLDRLPTELPFGRRRLVAIARAIAAQPSVLLLDEPAAGLDERETNELGNLIVRLAKEWGIAVLLIEHDVGLVLRVCDRVEALDFGRSIASGTPAEIAADEAVINAYLGAPDPGHGQLPISLAPAEVLTPATPRGTT
jgi:ABC-type branched-subunit amino acid transport system ATPase component/branched-subunit amino acid ABC-type transport system permease component